MKSFKIADALEMPVEAMSNTPLITLRGGGCITIEGFGRIVSFSRCEAAVLTKCGCVKVKGEGLYIDYIRKDIIKICGRIYDVIMA